MGYFLQGFVCHGTFIMFQDAVVERLHHRVLITFLTHGTGFGRVGNKKHFHQDAGHARADEHVEEGFFDAEVFNLGESARQAADQ